MIKISVIIPVYNTQDYLKECIDSVLNQTLADFEVICINDGSEDNSLDILKGYHDMDNRIKIVSQENRGLGASRNVGLHMAKGEYVLFLDSDDYLREDALESLYSMAIGNDLDLILFKIINFNYRTRRESRSQYFDMDFLRDIVKDDVFTWKQVKDCLFDISVTATSKLFKRDLLSDIEFPEGLLFEDNLFFIKVIFSAEKAYFLDDYFYYRRIRPDSITNSYYSGFSDCIIIYDRIIEFMKTVGRYDEFKCQIFDRQCFDLFHRFKLLEEEFKQDYYDKMKASFASYKGELEENGTLEMCSERSLVIFDNALNSADYHEFESSVNAFDSKISNEKPKSEKKQLKKSSRGEISRLTGKIRIVKRKLWK